MNTTRLHILVCLPLLLLLGSARAQLPQMISYTVKEGMPSNSVYRTVIDHRGFLWVATENGLARFDGKKFRTYTTADGLTDNEITDLVIDSSRRIWVIPFRRTPCYYNEQKDRFENDETDPELKKIELGSPHRPHLLQYGGVIFATAIRRLFIYRDQRTTELPLEGLLFKAMPVKIVEYKKDHFLFFCDDSLRFVSPNMKRLRASIPLQQKFFAAESEGNRVYLATFQGVYMFEYDSSGQVRKVQEKEFPFQLRIFCKTGNDLAVTSLNGSTYLLDPLTLQIKEEIFNTWPVRNVLKDKDNSIWLSTLNHGLIKMQRKRIASYDRPELKQDFSTIARSGPYLFLGSNEGKVVRFDGLYGIRTLEFNKQKTIDAWVRELVPVKEGYYVATQSGSFIINTSNEIVKDFRPGVNKSSKAAFRLDDSTLLLGNHVMTYRYNLRTGMATDSILKRVVSLGADLQGNVYIGSNEGLYRWDNKKLIYLGDVRKGFSYRINTIFTTADNLVWVGLGADSLMVMKNNQWVSTIPLGGLIPGNSCKAICSTRPGEIWLGTNKGLNRIAYSYDGEVFSYNNTFFSVADGLSGEQVNDIIIVKDTVFAATSDGVNYLPAGLQLPVSDIATYITGVFINNEQVDVKSSYSLRYFQNNITIDFSGVDLTGFIPVFEYSLNGGPWQRRDKIELANLPSGTYKIRIRALRRDGSVSKQEAQISFTIRTPFWKSALFWLALALTIFGGILYWQQRRNKQKQKAALEKVLTEKRITELEMQALKAQINPHFVFNCLNSIKGFIYDKDYRQADIYLDKFSSLMRSTIDNSDASIISLEEEVKYLENYLQLEQLRFRDKFDYRIEVAPDVDLQNSFVPAMLLQPYVENSIRHGIRFLENRKGLIRISAYKEKNYLVCEIDDNGIGRERAAALRSRQHTEYQSRGMTISKRRADLYHIVQEIVDKKDEKGEACGTTIIIKIPADHKP